ncbi:zinc finger, CCHC-type containing protein [Tanacetum coccineum]
MKDLLKQQGLDAALEELPTTTIVAYDNVIQKNAYNTLILCLGDRVLREGSGSVRSKSRGRGSKLRCYICNYEEHLKRDCPRRFYREDAVRREQGYKGFAGGTIRKKKANCVYTLDGQAMTRKTLKGRKQLGEYQTGCKIKTGNVGEYKETFMDRVVTLLVKVLLGVEFEVEPQEDHTFEVKPHGSVDHVVGSQEVQTQDLYKEDSNEATFAVAEAEKIYAHNLLTFNDTVACEVISKRNARLKEDMDARSHMYVLSNGCKESSDDINDYY